MDGLRRHRIIPAYAGSTPPSATLGGSCRDHPRIRGEHPGRTRPAPGTGRIIPAYAGSTHAVERARIEGPDHPRIRGEHLLSGVGGQDPAGSSPHTRGALSDAWRHWPVSGIIPAYAGSTSRLSRWRDSSPGSSPHTRGAQAMPSACAAQGGIIPAYAGSTGRCRPVRRHWRDHPRIRGEHHRPGEGPRPQEGSSPHTRGAPRPRPRRRRGDRIIPAYAGSTVDCVVVGFPEWDHPRIRGEHSSLPSNGRIFTGSSPHTRGAPGRGSGRSGRRRIIPAYAGSTSTTRG